MHSYYHKNKFNLFSIVKHKKKFRISFKILPFPQTQTSSFPEPPAAEIRSQVRRAQSAAVPSPLKHQPAKKNNCCSCNEVNYQRNKQLQLLVNTVNGILKTVSSWGYWFLIILLKVNTQSLKRILAKTEVNKNKGSKWYLK